MEDQAHGNEDVEDDNYENKREELSNGVVLDSPVVKIEARAQKYENKADHVNFKFKAVAVHFEIFIVVVVEQSDVAQKVDGLQQ